MLRPLFLACTLCITTLFGAGEAQAKLRVITSFSILKDMAQQVGQDLVQVESIIGADSDAHEFEPSPAQVKTLSQAQVFITNGAGMDDWAKRLTKAAQFKGRLIVASQDISLLPFEHAEEIKISTSRRDDHDHSGHKHGAYDPHIWQDPARGIQMVNNIAQGFAQADPEHAQIYLNNAQSYTHKIQALHVKMFHQLAQLKPEHRKFITTHEAFAYFGKAFNLNIVAVMGISTSAEPSARRLAKIIQFIREHKVKAVFLENIKNPKILNQIARESGAKIGGTLYSDALASTGPASTYLGLLEHNANQVTEALK